MLDTLARRHSDRVALIPEIDSLEVAGGPVTYAAMARESRAAAESLRGAGVQAGDRVAILAENSLRWIHAWFGANLLGATVVPVNTRLTPSEVLFQLVGSRASLLIADEPRPQDQGVLELVAHNLASLQEVCPVVWLRDDPRAPAPALGPKLRSIVTSHPTVAEAKQGGMIQFTSGSTNSPKGAILAEDAILAVAQANANRLLLSCDDVFLGSSPLYHNSGSVATSLAAFVAGATVTMMSRWSVDRALETMTSTNVTVVNMIDAIARELLEAANGRASGAVERLRLISTASAADGCARLLELADVDVTNLYGLTECSPTVAIGDLRDSQATRMQSSGRPHAGIEVQMVDPDGARLPAGEVGEIQVRGWNVMSRYLGIADDEQPFTPEGWLVTGDRGRLTAEGYLEFLGRIKDMVKSGGENVSALEVETYLKRHSSVREAAVVGVQDDRWGERVVAFVELTDDSPQPTTQELAAFAREGLAQFKRPKDIVVIRDWPLTGSGKISKPKLSELLGHRA
jgi:fatty-acyl-CoA synthase